MARPTPEAIAEAIATLRVQVSTGSAERALEVLERASVLPELMGRTATAAEYGVATGNLDKIVGLPEPLFKLPAGSFYDADAIREHAKARRDGAAPTTTAAPAA